MTLACQPAQAGSEQTLAIDQVKDLFTSPPTQYTTAPFWVWNDMLTEEQVISTLNDFAGQNIKQAFVHPRPGLMTPYLSDRWFELWKAALNEAERLDMDLWIYDENSYPSGFAGGLVPEAMPESKGCGVFARETNEPPKPSDEVIAVHRLMGQDYVNVTSAVRSNQKLPDGEYIETVLQYVQSDPWYAGKYYVDLLNPKVTETFLEITMGAYQGQVGESFGGRVPGVFTDEPILTPAGSHHWTGDLAEQFSKRWSYDLMDHWPAVFRPVGDFKRIRHNYYQTLNELFIDRWVKPYHDYCREHHLEFTGHYWEHAWPNARPVCDNMAMYAWHQRPAIDILFNQYNEGTNAQFGNVRAVKELSSVANQLGQKRTLCETFGGSGWDTRFEDLKRIGDWVSVLGVNTINEHLSYISLRGARKHDYPPSFSYHQPWWQAYHVLENYFSRLSAALSHGEEINQILVIEPTTTAWMYQGINEDLTRIADPFQQLITSLSKAQVEYDLGCEDIIARHGDVDKDKFVIGRRKYHTVVLSPFTENLNIKTVELLEQFLQNGGSVLCCGQPPVRVDGKESDRGLKLADSKNWQNISKATLLQKLASENNDGFKIHRAADDSGILFHQRRAFKEGQLLFLVNTSIESTTSGSIESPYKSIEQWDPQTGTYSAYAFASTNGKVTASFNLEPCGSLLLFFSNSNGTSAEPVAEKVNTVPAHGSLTAKRIGPNVLTIDYVDVSAGGQTKKNLHFFKANQFAFRQNGLERNPWDCAVQFRDEIIRQTFDKNSGFAASYHFTIDQHLPTDLWIVIERPDLYEITCNQKPVIADKGTWWLDKSFGKINIADAVNPGDNVVSIKASPFTVYHELEPAYLVGDFGLKPADSGFILTASASDLKIGSWKEQGCPFYAEGVVYTQPFDIEKPDGEYFVQLKKWYGSVIEVKVNGKSAEYIAYRPWRCEVTSFIHPGINSIEVIVTGTLRNTLGPHHAGDLQGIACPPHFRQGPENGPPPGNQYQTIDYGLFEPFKLIQTVMQ